MRTVIVGLVLAAIASGGEKTPGSGAFSSMVESEREFARTCSRKGVRASFIQFFADDGIAFKPEPFSYKEFIKNLPPQPDPMVVSLKWEPQFAGVASSGDLGFSTGPSIRIDTRDKDRTKHYGQFFSIWMKQKNGKWRVAVDIGTSMPAPASPFGLLCKESVFTPTAPNQSGARLDPLTEMMRLEHWFSEACLAGGAVRAYLQRTTEETRLHREDHLPIIGTDAVRLYLGSMSFVPSWTPSAGKVSIAGDLGYTYGSYELKSSSDNATTVEKGYYLHVWKRDEKGAWKLLADITNPQSPEGKK